jgi:hypothetical protein
MCFDPEKMSKATARLLALGIFYDTEGLAYKTSEKTREIFYLLLDFADEKFENLEEEFQAALTPEEKKLMELISETGFLLPLNWPNDSKFQEDKVMVFLPPEKIEFPPWVYEGALTDRLLNAVLRQGVDFSVYLKPIQIRTKKQLRLLGNGEYKGKVGDTIWELKMRSNQVMIAGAIGSQSHRGGHGGNAKAEVWPGQDFELNPNYIYTKDEIRQLVLDYFAKLYIKVRTEEDNHSAQV